MQSNPDPRSLNERMLSALADATDGVVVLDQHGAVVFANRQAEALFGYQPGALVGMPIDAVAADFGRDAGDWRRRHQRALASADISNALLAGRAVEDVLTLIAEQSREVAGADEAWIVTPRPDMEDALEVRAAGGSEAKALLGLTVPRTDSMSGEVMRVGTPIVVDSAADDTRVAEVVRELGYGPAMYLPLVAAEQRFGAMIVARQQGRPHFSDADVSTAQLFAGSASIALAFAETRAQLEQGRLAAEQERIAGELLRGVVHDLYALGLSLQTTAGMVDRASGVGPRLDEAIGKVDEVIRTIRTMVFAMVEAEEAEERDPAPSDAGREAR